MIVIETIVISILAGLASGLASGFIVRLTTKSKYEIAFEKNVNTAYNNLFATIAKVDVHKQQIYDMWEPHESCKNFNVVKSLDPFVYSDIKYHKNIILKQIERITLYKNSSYVLLSEYLLLLRYCLSAYTSLHEDSGIDNGMGMDERSLEYHRFYAKEIITTFSFVPETFANKWRPEFEKLGGPTYIVKPPLEPGDTPAVHLFGDEIMDFDPHYRSIMEMLREIKDKKCT